MKSFDMKKFMATKFEPRTEEVRLDDLKDFFPDGVEPVFTVRGLTGEEIARVNDAVTKNRNLAAVVDAMAATNAADKADAIKEALGLSPGVPDDLAKRIENLVYGCVDPVFDQPAAVRLFKVFPVEAYQLTNVILRLTGQGQKPGESKPSGKAKTSG